MAAANLGPARAAPAAESLRIAGLSRLSSVDWPGRLAATIFLQGCPWDCFYCHNPSLIDPRTDGAIAWEQVEQFARSRVGLLDAVVFSGGEPTMQPGLGDAVSRVRDLGFAVGLHTGGAYPAALGRLLPQLDWVGLDIKTTDAAYDRVTGRPGGAANAWRSLELVLGNQALREHTDRPLAFEVRTTVHPAAIDDHGLGELGCRLADAGVRSWAVQRFRATGARSPLPRVGQTAAEPQLDRIPRTRFASFTIR
ncbi:anaerobic ribonucleoside-triphosphate reductase activating protein [Microbacterium fluvii]|uniref:Anaerobic ribonucleoside-triphosphate reductase activating protein n=1 Tax=Microbacterium fluvii TaxID=415215 RepID=A0ABW2HFM1_9MICO|nr:anaerobic ribonucleoside-triphosphate reductase activating protein [Microbacterium fluvii]MCU4673564.1 anaerobic ribonucleoside-triphosphate reductase activating protein [Microbacterium fluvii]